MRIKALSVARLGTTRLRVDPHLAPVGINGGSQGYASEIRVGKPGKCPERPVLTIALFDNSGSILGGNDPIGQRFLEAEVAIARVGRRCQCGRDMAAVLHFDTPTSGDLEPTPITRPNWDQIHRSLAVPPDGRGISCLGPSLRAAQQLADRYQASHDLTLIALTDFELFDDYLDELIGFPGHVHAVAMRGALPQKLSDAPEVTVTAINYESRPGTVARAVFAALTKTRPKAKPLPASALTEVRAGKSGVGST